MRQTCTLVARRVEILSDGSDRVRLLGGARASSQECGARGYQRTRCTQSGDQPAIASQVLRRVGTRAANLARRQTEASRHRHRELDPPPPRPGELSLRARERFPGADGGVAMDACARERRRRASPPAGQLRPASDVPAGGLRGSVCAVHAELRGDSGDNARRASCGLPELHHLLCGAAGRCRRVLQPVAVQMFRVS